MLRVLDRGHVKQVIQKVEAAWNGSAPSERSTFEFDRIRRFLAGSPGLSRESSPKKMGFQRTSWFGAVQTGSYLGEDDIIRIEDDYRRRPEK